jgi:hypothetical protein
LERKKLMTDEVVYAPIPGFLGYEVGTDGNVWSWRGPGGKVTERHLLIPKTTKKGYKIVTLRSKLNGNRRFFVHRLVLLAFIGPCPGGMECCHWNGDPADNRLSNLRWDTHKANCADTVRNGRIGGFCKPRPQDCIERPLIPSNAA